MERVKMTRSFFVHFRRSNHRISTRRNQNHESSCTYEKELADGANRGDGADDAHALRALVVLVHGLQVAAANVLALCGG